MREVIGACSLDCPDGCSWVVTVDDAGRAVALRGNADHPFTAGGLCAKVNPYLDYAASADRLLHPLRRVGAKGEGRFARVSWDEALDELATRLRETADRYGGEAIWPYRGTGSVSWLQGLAPTGGRLFHALGASRHDLDICSRAGTVGMGYTAGTPAGMDPADLQHSRLVILWGTNTLTTNLHLWPYVTRARERGARLVVVDPVRTRTAARADRHLAPRPGTDGALVLGLIAGLLERGAADEEFLAGATLGWGAFRDEVVSGWTPQRAAEVCGLTVGEVEWLADEIARSRPTGIRTLMGVQRHGGGGQAVRLMSCLPAVTGDYVRLGGGLCYSTGSAYPLDGDALTRPDLQPHGPTRRLRMSALGSTLLDATDPPVMALVMWGANPVVSNPDQRRVRAGLSREDLFVVAVEHTLTDTTAYADLVLPGTTQLEHTDLTDSYSHLFLNWNAPAVQAPGECLPHTEIFRRLATALGRHDPLLHAGDEDLARDALGGGHPALDGVTLERLQERGWVRLAWPDPYLPFTAGFPTPSGRFEFSSRAAADDGAGLLPHYLPPHEVPSPTSTGADVEVALVSAANHYLINSTFNASPRHTRRGAPVVRLHPDDAAAAGIADGDLVQVGNERGRFAARAAVTTEVRRGVAATTKGLLPGRPGASSVNATTGERRADLGGATFHDNRVVVRPWPDDDPEGAPDQPDQPVRAATDGPTTAPFAR
jgi:anaerobic selenocysteine-containing dehydrogenase